MKRVFAVGAMLVMTLGPTGCVAVSAKDIHTGARYEAVAASDGKIYVVDKQKTRAWPVTMLPARPVDTGSEG